MSSDVGPKPEPCSATHVVHDKPRHGCRLFGDFLRYGTRSPTVPPELFRWSRRSPLLRLRPGISTPLPFIAPFRGPSQVAPVQLSVPADDRRHPGSRSLRHRIANFFAQRLRDAPPDADPVTLGGAGMFPRVGGLAWRAHRPAPPYSRPSVPSAPHPQVERAGELPDLHLPAELRQSLLELPRAVRHLHRAESRSVAQPAADRG
jgi:hypothetical protein